MASPTHRELSIRQNGCNFFHSCARRVVVGSKVNFERDYSCPGGHQAAFAACFGGEQFGWIARRTSDDLARIERVEQRIHGVVTDVGVAGILWTMKCVLHIDFTQEEIFQMQVEVDKVAALEARRAHRLANPWEERA